MSTFRIIFTVVIIAFAVLGMIVIATFRGGDTAAFGNTNGAVVVWGTLPQEMMGPFVATLRQQFEGFEVTYVEKQPEAFDQELVEAIASGRSPDVALLPSELILRFEDKVSMIPYDYLSERDFRDDFIEGSEIYLSPQGIIGLPFVVDPLVMYWNRDLFANARKTLPPTTWEEVKLLAREMTIQTQGVITTSAIALGEWRNITHAKEIFAHLLLAGGNPIVSRTSQGLTSVLGNSFNKSPIPAEAALIFYTDFSNPNQLVYSWNRALRPSREMFLAGKLGIYFGLGSDVLGLHEANPNLNFDVAEIPRTQGADSARGFGKFHAFSVLRSAPNPSGAFTAAQVFTSPEAGTLFTTYSTFAPARRALLAETPTDPFRASFFRAAIIARAWLDPNPQESDSVFQEMIESASSGSARINQAVLRAHEALRRLLQ